MLALVTALYGSLAALLIVITALGVVKVRRREGIGLDNGGNKSLTHAMRIHANLVEYAPISVLLLLFLELNQAETVWLHTFGIVFLFARVIHLWGFSSNHGYSHGRFLGTLITLLNIIAMSLANVFLLLRTV
ncbi:MAG: MAPEG family protein [Pseudomonadota bacterium]